MCLITNSKLKIAKKDKIVYKLLSNSLYAPYHRFKYELDIVYKTKLKESNSRECFDDISRNYLDKNFENWRPKNIICIGEGFHSALNKKRLSIDKNEDEILVECTIPEGSEYYTEPTGLLVSNQIIIKKKI